MICLITCQLCSVLIFSPGPIQILPLISRRLVNNSAISQFQGLLSNADWSDVREACKNNDPSTAYSQFIESYTQLYDKVFPLLHSPEIKKNSSSRFKQPWMTSALLKSCNKKSRLYLKYLKNPTAANKLTFTTYRNKFKQPKRSTLQRNFKIVKI